MRSNTEDFIEKAKRIHGDIYDYSLVEYTTTLNIVKIICPVHGEFNQVAANHLSGKGCKECGRYKKRKRDFKDILKSCNEMHNNYYKYAEPSYSNVRKISSLFALFMVGLNKELITT